MLLQGIEINSELISAGILHDVVEDTDATLDDIKNIFGYKVMSLVKSNSEDKSKTWEQRKMHTVLNVPSRTRDEFLLMFADKLCNLRSIYYDYKEVGDKIWDRFNKGKEPQAWYYIALFKKFIEYNKRNTAILPARYIIEYRNMLEELFGDEKEWSRYRIEVSGLEEVLDK